ncbi:MAG: hypothetical protein JWQ84_1948 [Mucilaginibacter sp.]|jgi:hypothetical protein|nr:hypothetical protein [Mucilaginibacter sp.]MDB5140578.1 hypothetical protein [Mucilaginibacter sp.]
MKTSIKLTALFLLASVSVFAASPVKVMTDGGASKEMVTFSSLPSNKGLDIKVNSPEASKAIVIVYNKDGEAIFKDIMPKFKTMEKGYILNQLEYGDYTLEVTANHQTVKKAIHVYDDAGKKDFFIQQ